MVAVSDFPLGWRFPPRLRNAPRAPPDVITWSAHLHLSSNLSKLMGPDFDRFALTPLPVASWRHLAPVFQLVFGPFVIESRRLELPERDMQIRPAF